MDDNTATQTPDAIDISRADMNDRQATWRKLAKSLAEIETNRGIDHVKVLTTFFGTGDGLAETVERIGTALYERPDKQHILFMSDTASANDHWDPGTLYVNVTVSPGVGAEDADAVYSAILEDILHAAVGKNPCKLRWRRDDDIADGIISAMTKRSGAPEAPAPDTAA